LHRIPVIDKIIKNNADADVVLAEGCAIPDTNRYYYLYSITNKVNGNLYIGAHQTTDINDGYMGSGKVLKYAIKKYGKGNFIKTILQFFTNSVDMFDTEMNIVNEEFIAREDTYNIAIGGRSGSAESNGLSFKGRTHTPEAREKLRIASTGRQFSDEARRKMSAWQKGKALTDEHKQKLSEARLRFNAEKRAQRDNQSNS
jgi:hypothetical protein